MFSPRVAVVRLRRWQALAGPTTTVLVLAAPLLLVVGPCSLPVVVGDVAVEEAPALLVFAAVLLLRYGPSRSPVRKAGQAVVVLGRRRGRRAAEVPVLAAPAPHDLGPLRLRRHAAGRAVVGGAGRRWLRAGPVLVLAAPGLLLSGPTRLPSGISGIAVVGVWACNVPLLATPVLLLRGPQVAVPMLAVDVFASGVRSDRGQCRGLRRHGGQRTRATRLRSGRAAMLRNA
mmetsp:Transcript_91585/g.296293  ORF Transcript_91585/g.296293 Transcript_91585/m.296293 type:complete len:230 (-) Transcript_91585:1508-2197(-)